MRLHFVTTIENRQDFHSMARLWAFSIRSQAGIFSSMPISIACNDTLDEGFASEMREKYDAGVTCFPSISRVMLFANKYNALSLPGISSADWVMWLDSDTIVASELDPLDSLLASSSADFLGVGEFPCKRVFGLPKFYTRFGGVMPERLHEYQHPWNPLGLPYFNGGVWLIRGSHAEKFQARELELTFKIFAAMRASSLNPLHWAKVQWNRKVYKSKYASRLVIQPFVPKFYSEQIAIGLAAVSLGLKIGNLPRAYDWMCDSPTQGENYPIRVLHYVQSMYPLDKATLLQGAWAPGYAASGEPGKVALAETWNRYREWSVNGTFNPSRRAQQQIADCSRGGPVSHAQPCVVEDEFGADPLRDAEPRPHPGR